MNNLITIFKREFSVYFQTLIGYIFIIVYLLISLGLFITPFFTFPNADMRNFFSLQPIIFLFFIPVATMRLWAEEKRENTFEMLMTFPMQSYEVVLGKYLAALAFFKIAIAGTLILPIMMVVLGNPDLGAIFTSYFGTVLLGAMLLSLGIFISGQTKDQIVSFIVTLLVMTAMFLMGTDFISSYLDGVIGGLGSFLSDVLGFSTHYDSFLRGVIEITDVIYFLTWTAIFLFLNGFYLEIRNKPDIRVSFSSGIALSLAVGLLFNWLLSDISLGRLDLTEGQIHTVSKATQKVLGQLKVPVNVNFYVTPKDKMPTELKTLEQDVVDKLTEMKIASNNQLTFTTIYLEASNVMNQEGEEKEADKKEDPIEKRMLDKGVKPFSAQAIREDSMVNVLVYSAMGVAYKDKKEEIIPQVVPQNIHELEYLVVSSVFKMTREKMPVVAMVAPKEAFNISPMMRQLYQQMGRPIPQSEDPYEFLEQILQHEKYEVKRVDLTEESPLPEEFDTLVVINPRELNDRQKFEINKALVEGKNVFLAVQNFNWNYQMQERNINITRQEEKPQIEDLLSFYGATISSNILMDNNHQPMTVSDPSNPLANLLGGGMTLDLPIQIMLGQESMNPDISITSRLSGIFYLWGSALEINADKIKENKLTSTQLMTTSDQGWTVEGQTQLTQEHFKKPDSGLKKIPVSVMLSGEFPNFFKDKDRPAWPKQNPDGSPAAAGQSEKFADYKPKAGKLLLVGGTQMFRKNFLQGQGRANLDFFMNSVDALSLGDDLINIRAKKMLNRAIPKPSKGQRFFWKFANYGLVNIIFALIGVTIYQRRKRARELYTAQHNA